MTSRFVTGEVCHSDAALAAAQEFANVFVRAARGSSHRFPTEAFDDVALYQHRPYGLFEEYTSYGYYYIRRDEAKSAELLEAEVVAAYAASQLGRSEQQRRAADRSGKRTAALGPIVGVLSVPDPPCVTYFTRLLRRRQGPLSLRELQARAPLSCFASFYPDWLHTAGARVAPIPYTANATRLRSLFAGANRRGWCGHCA